MKLAVSSFFAIALLLCISCASKVALPIKTSLGDLVRIENKDKVATNKETISPKSGEVAYVLSFEGKKEIEVKDVSILDVYRLAHFPLVDSSGKEFAPVFAGSPTQDGSLSNAEVKLTGDMGAKDGQYLVTTGKLSFPESKLTLVYLVSKDASLALKDGGQRYPIN